MASSKFNVPLVMTVGEIVSDYRQAKNKKNQIDILADLNGTSATRIAWLLSKAGCEVPVDKLPAEGSKLIERWVNTDEAKEAQEINMRLNPPKPLPDPPPEPEQVHEPTEQPAAEQPTAEEQNETNLYIAIAGFWNNYLIFRLEFPMHSGSRGMLTGKDVQRMLELVEMTREVLNEEDHS